MTPKELRILDRHLTPFIPDEDDRKKLQQAVLKEIVEMYIARERFPDVNEDEWDIIIIRGRLLEESRRT